MSISGKITLIVNVLMTKAVVTEPSIILMPLPQCQRIPLVLSVADLLQWLLLSLQVSES